MIIYPEELANCDKRIIALADELNRLAKDKFMTDLIITSGKRNGNGKSWHDKGLAIDFNFKDVHSFKIISIITNLAINQEAAFKGVTEVEVCAGYSKTGDRIHHVHLAFGDEKKIELFTGIYN